MKKTLKLVPAIAMLLISAIMLSTATFAWFSMNNRVTVTGMTLKTKVSSNLLISPDTDEANFITALAQTRAALLEPTSTVDGESFYYTVNAKADGSKASGDWTAYDEDGGTVLDNPNAGKQKYDDAFNTAYAVTTKGSTANYETAYGYVDYDFYLKATSTADTTQNVAMTYCSLLYNNNPITEKAWRVAVLASAPADTADGTGALSLKAILAPNSAAYQTSGKAVASTTLTGDVSELGTAATIGSLTKGQVKYFHVIVRVWLEGEDTTCRNSTFATLTNEYSFTCDFVLSSFNGIQEIKSVSRQATATNTLLEATATLNTSETTGATYQWYLDDGTKINGQTAPTYTGTAGQEVYCIVSTTSGQAYQTNNVTLVSE